MTHLLLKRRAKTVLFRSRDTVLICWRNWREIFILPMTSTPPPDGNYGAEAENGTWNGVIGELINRVGIKQSIHFLPWQKNRGQRQKITKTMTKRSFLLSLKAC